MTLKKSIRGVTMVEMLAVLSIIAIIVAIIVPNAIYARVSSEEAAIRAQSATLEVAMGNYQASQGNAAVTAWNAVSTGQAEDYYNVLYNANVLPQQVTWDQFSTVFSGYTVQFPSTLSGQVVVTRTVDDAQIYP